MIYLIQFSLQFLIFTFYTRNSDTRLLRNSRNLHLSPKNNAIVAKPLLESPGKEQVVPYELYLIKALNNVFVVRCNSLRFGVNFDKILLNKNIQKRIIFIYNNDIAAARVELWSSSTNAKYAESSSTNYILCEKQKKYKCSFFKKML